MIPSNYQVKYEEKKTYDPLPKNVYTVEILSVDMAPATGKYAKEGDMNFVFQFTLLDGTEKGESLRGRNVWNNFVPTSIYLGKNGKNSLWEIVEACIKRELTQAEVAYGLTGDKINSLIGKQLKIFVDHRVKDGKTYDTITSYIKSDGYLTPLTAEERDAATVKDKKNTTIIPAELINPDLTVNQTPAPLPVEQYSDSINVEALPW